MKINTSGTEFHVLVVKVENKPGVLTRVAGLFARRGFNIDTLAVAPTDDERFSRITISVDAESAPLEQVVKQLDKLVNVVEIRDLDSSQSVERELMLVRNEDVEAVRAQRRRTLVDEASLVRREERAREVDAHESRSAATPASCAGATT